MSKRIIIAVFAISLIIWGTSFTETEQPPKFTEIGSPIALVPPDLNHSRAVCTIQKHDDTALGFYSGFVTNDKIVTYFDIEAECGASSYPYELQSLTFTFFAPTAAYQWPIEVDVVVYDLAGADSCGGPGAELCRFSVTCDSAIFRLPHIGTANFPSPCCVNGPVYIGLEYTDTDPGTFPSVVFDKSAPVPMCENWGYSIGTWFEWYSFWGSPQPGYPIYWVEGETVSSACGPKILLDEVQPWTGTSGVGDSLFSVAEISNTGFAGQDLTGWYLRGASVLDEILLPSWTIPAGAYLRIEFGTGTNDADFSDGMATYFAGSTSWQFELDAGEVGLYDGPAIVDFVAWGETTSTFGDAYTDAIGNAGWTAGEFVDITSGTSLGVLARTPSGFDNNETLDWRIREMPYGIQYDFHNPVQISPRPGYLSNTTPLLEWFQVGDGSSDVQLLVDDDSLFLSPVISLVTGATNLDTALAGGTYYWRIIPSNPGGPYPAAVWRFSIDTTLPDHSMNRQGSDAGFGFAPVPQKYQHKDTKLLCIWHLKNSTRPGCTEAAGAIGPWDGAHATGDHIKNCHHCDSYCTRASIQMVNSKYGGNLTQDEISYHMKENDVVGPEGDLGHKIGAWPQEETSYSWAMNNAAVAENFIAPDGPIPWATFKAEIDAGRPVITVIRPPGWFHTVVFDSYYENAAGKRWVYISDPWPGRTGWYEHLNMPCVRYYTIAAGPTGRNTDPNVALDSDADGIMDFDEQRPSAGTGQTARPFHCVHNDKDTDDDQVEDKPEIRNYTFHDQAGYHPGHENDPLNFPDIDGDNLRAENDCDSDNDSDFDGGEDINGNGNNPIPSAGNVCTRETCQFLSAEFCLSVAVDKDTYFLGEPVYIVDNHFSRQTHTYHANSTYNYEKGPFCPTKADGSGLGHNGSFTTDGGGHARQTLVEFCLTPGIKYLTVDVLDDNLYSTPDNLDPQTCWECIADWFHGFHYATDYTYHNAGSTWPGYSYPVTCITEGPNPSLITYTIECPWWWWCYVWPPVLDRYWLAVRVDRELIENNIITITQPPSIVQGTPQDCNPPPLQLFNFDPQLTFELEGTSPDPQKQWLAFSTQQWQLPDSQLSTRLPLQIAVGTKFAATPYVDIMAGDSVYGWSPTPYDSIPITVIATCCISPRGDVNSDGSNANILDLNFLVNRIFRGGPAAACPEEADCNSDGTPSNILDLNFLVNRIFRGGALPGPC